MKVTGRGSIQPCEDKPRKRCRKWRLFVRADGRQRTRVVNGTYSQAQDALRAFITELSGRIESREEFAAYADTWVGYKRSTGEYAPGTMRNFERDTRALKRVLGNARLSALDPRACREALMRLKNGGSASGRTLSGTYMNDIYGVLNAILSSAVDDGIIATNPLAKVAPPKVDTKERGWMPPGEFEAFTQAVAAAPLDGRVMAVLFMAQLGLRRGEACGIYDADVDGGVARIRRAVKEDNGAIGGPKSKAGERTLPLPPLLAQKVAEWRAVRDSSPLLRGARTLCCDTRGGVLRPQNLYRWWEANKAGFGAEGYTLHQIRHSNLSMMARHMSPFDLKTWAGWSSIEPAKVYIHDDTAALERAVLSAFGG